MRTIDVVQPQTESCSPWLNNIQGSASPIESILGTCTYLRRQVRAEGGGGGTLLGGGEGGGAGNERGNDGRLEHGFVYCYCIGETGMRKELNS